MFDRQALYDIMTTGAKYVKRPGDLVRSTTQGINVNDLTGSGYSLSNPFYSDQIPPFDVTLVGRPNKGIS